MKRVLFRASSSTSSFAQSFELDSNDGNEDREMVWWSVTPRLYAITCAFGSCGYEAAMNCFPWPEGASETAQEVFDSKFGADHVRSASDGDGEYGLNSDSVLGLVRTLYQEYIGAYAGIIKDPGQRNRMLEVSNQAKVLCQTFYDVMEFFEKEEVPPMRPELEELLSERFMQLISLFADTMIGVDFIVHLGEHYVVLRMADRSRRDEDVEWAKIDAHRLKQEGGVMTIFNRREKYRMSEALNMLVTRVAETQQPITVIFRPRILVPPGKGGWLKSWFEHWEAAARAGSMFAQGIQPAQA